MDINISNLIESITNPNGRFRTLDGIYVVRTSGGDPSMAVGERTVRFDTVWNGAEYTMKCFLRTDGVQNRALKEISLYTEHIECRHLTPYMFLEDEMLVFDDFDTPGYVDVVLQRKPSGERLDRHMTRIAASGEQNAIWELIGRLSDMAEWLCGNDFSHGNICAGNIYTAGSDLVLINYSQASRTRSYEDLTAVGSLAAALCMSACQPELYGEMIHEKILTTKELSKLTHVIANIMYGCGIAELDDLLTALTADEKVPDASLCAAIRRLASARPRRVAALGKIAETMRKNGEEPSVEKYAFIGPMQDMVMRVSDGTRWFYIDNHGDMAFAGYFASADDFCEGRAVVETAEGYGLIDLAGNFVIPPRYDDMEWDGANNVAIATCEGLSGLYSREGETLTGLIYDQILPASEGMFPVRKNGKYGFIRRDGIMAIKPRFDDAFGFRDGFARVSNGNRQFLINTEGCVIDNIPQKTVLHKPG